MNINIFPSCANIIGFKAQLSHKKGSDIWTFTSFIEARSFQRVCSIEF